MTPTNRPAHHSPLTTPQSDPWHLDAVFYEVPVKSFFDSNGDGIGDFPGLTAKLDYIAELGVTCVWLLPFHPSPMRDDGYDVADYRDVHPAYGTMEDFRTFLREAHRRGLKVAAEMVVNHTSDRHPWFQAARTAPAGSPLRDFYVWSETDLKFREARARCPDAGRSSWTWDPEAEAYYWHRFSEVQPDLNYDNPAVRTEMLNVLRFWADQGVDGLCLNRASYLVEREGTPCEHLPETHAILKEMRRELEAAYPGVMLQTGLDARQESMRPYFGDGDECHMAPHLRLAQRLFLAVRQEDRHPIADILRQMPDLPAGCQWMTLLRNHDELTLTLATDEERVYMFREYAADPRTRLPDGILRRLAPLADNSRRRIEMLFGLLFALPGAPVIYYGDEIGMGDNVFLRGRAAIRTPMQWTGDRNAGFSTADAAQLYAPPVSDPVFGYQAVNVEAGRRDTSSLFHWVRRLVAARKRSVTLSRGDVVLLESENRRVLAFVRRLAPSPLSVGGTGKTGGETILVVANLSPATQPVELDLAAFAGSTPVEMFGEAEFPRIGPSPYLITLGPHALHWFRLRGPGEDGAARPVLRTTGADEAAILEVPGGWDGIFDGTARETLERSILPGFLRSQRWFGGKARKIESVRVADRGPLPTGPTEAFLVLLEVRFAGGAQDLYFLPLAVTAGEAAVRLYETMRPWVLARLTGPGGEAVLHDALAAADVCSALLSVIGEGREFPTRAGRIRAEATAAYGGLRGDPNDPLPVVRGPATSSNSLVFYGRRLLLKLFRRLEAGINPDYEIGRFLTEGGRFTRIPQAAGTFEYHREDGGGPFTLGIVQALVPNQGDGWQHALDELSRYYRRAAGRMSGPDLVPSDPRPLPELIGATPRPAALEVIGTYLRSAATLGRRTAEMHLALASDADDSDFAPEPMTAADADRIREEILAQGHAALSALGDNIDRLPDEITPEARRLLDEGPTALEALARRTVAVPDAAKIRVHGDYHLGQVLWVENDYVILDFEGEPTRTVEQRRQKFSPVRDIAGMLRSYHYAAFAGLFAFAESRPGDFPRLVPWAELWHRWVSAAFLREYLATAKGAAFLPPDPAGFAGLLDSFMLAKALYELSYELNNRPDWVRIPLEGVSALLGDYTSGPRP